MYSVVLREGGRGKPFYPSSLPPTQMSEQNKDAGEQGCLLGWPNGEQLDVFAKA